MGGTFNPIHNGHLILAQEAKEQFQLDEIWFLPSKRQPHKDSGELPEDEIRLAMLQAAISDNPSFTISMLEMQRDDKKLTYTFDTMVELKEKYPEIEFSFIIGEDSLVQLHKWYHFEDLLKGMIFLVAPRPGQAKMEEMKKIAEEYEKKYHARIGIIDMPMMEISSTAVREKAADGKSVRYYLPECVETMIRTKQIYRKNRQ
jgi:nicotinate-nucleotide adenylyltransferase